MHRDAVTTHDNCNTCVVTASRVSLCTLNITSRSWLVPQSRLSASVYSLHMTSCVVTTSRVPLCTHDIMSRHMTTTAITCICRSCLVAQSSLRMPSCVVTASRVSLCTHDIKSSALVYACVEMQSHDNCNTCIVTAARVSLCSD